MAVGIGAGGILGVAIEAVAGTYVAPTKYIPFNSESLKYNTNPVERRPIRNSAGLIGVIPGNATVEGDIEFDISADVLLYFLVASRCTYVKSGTAPSLSYVFTPQSNALPAKTLSISIKRGDEVFGYTGCVVGGFTIAIDSDGKFTATVNIFGRNEATQAALTPVWPTAPVFYAGMYSLQIPTATQVFDADTYEFSSEDNAVVNSRIRNTPAASFVNFGESNATVKVERDFDTRADYDSYKAGTARSITLEATADVSNKITILTPVAIANTYEVNIGSQGDLIRASIEYASVVGAGGFHYRITIITSENIT